MGVVVRPGNTFELSCRDKLSGKDACSSLNTLAAIVGELHLLFVEVDAVAEDAEHGTRTHDIGIEAFLLQRVVLGKTCLINQIHGFVHGVFDVLVVRSQGEEIVVEHLHMGLGFHIESLLHGASLDKDGHIAIQHIYFLMGIGHHYLGCPNAGDTDDDTAQKEEGADNQNQLDLVFEILDNHIFNRFSCLYHFVYHALGGHLGLLCHTFTEVTGRECRITLWYHPCGKVGHEVQALQSHDARCHEVAGREEGVLKVGCHGLLALRDGCEVLHLYAEHDVKEQQDIETDEVWGMIRFRKSK